MTLDESDDILNTLDYKVTELDTDVIGWTDFGNRWHTNLTARERRTTFFVFHEFIISLIELHGCLLLGPRGVIIPEANLMLYSPSGYVVPNTTRGTIVEPVESITNLQDK